MQNQTQDARYAQTIDAAIKMLKLCGVTFMVVEDSVLVMGRDGLVYSTIVLENPTPIEIPNPYEAPAKSTTPATAKSKLHDLYAGMQAQASLPLEDKPVVAEGKKKRSVDLLSRTDIPMESRIKFRRKIKSRYVSLFQPYLVTLAVGDVAQIPLSIIPAESTPEKFRSAVSAWAYDAWGKTSHRTCVTDTHIEVLRTR